MFSDDFAYLSPGHHLDVPSEGPGVSEYPGFWRPRSVAEMTLVWKESGTDLSVPDGHLKVDDEPSISPLSRAYHK
jgi:hypothetical protein